MFFNNCNCCKKERKCQHGYRNFDYNDNNFWEFNGYGKEDCDNKYEDKCDNKYDNKNNCKHDQEKDCYDRRREKCFCWCCRCRF